MMVVNTTTTKQHVEGLVEVHKNQVFEQGCTFTVLT